MPALTPNDLKRVEFYCQKGYTGRRICDILLPEGKGSKTAIYRMVKRYQEQGSIRPTGQPGAPLLITSAARDYLLDVLYIKKEYKLEELQAMLIAKFDLPVSKQTIARCIHHPDFTNRMEMRHAFQGD